MAFSDTASQRSPVRFALFAAASQIHETAALRDLVESYLAPLRALGGGPWDPGAEPAALPLVVLVATGGTERRILQAVQDYPQQPALLVAHPGHNSLPASLEVLARLQQLGIRGQILYLRGPADEDGLRRLAEAVRDSSVRCALLGSRIGLVGEPSDWLVASTPSAAVVRAVWGPTVVPVPLEPVLLELESGTATGGDALAVDFGDGATDLAEPAESDLRAAGRVHAALWRLVEAERLDAVAVRCFDLVTRAETTGCLALAQLNDQGIVAGCEGDLVATVAMLWLRRMTGAAAWMANPSRIDPERGVLSLAHCTVPRGMTGAYRLRSHFESGLGVGLQGVMPAGPVTLVRIGGARMERLRAVDGSLLGNTDHPDLCRTQVEVEVGHEALQDLLADPLGNHVVMAAGHHAAALRSWHRAMIG